MGKLINGINGMVTGKVGSIHGSSLFGKPYIKGPHKKRTTNISLKEADNRKRFSTAQAFLRPLLPFVRQGFNGFAYRPTAQGFLAAKSHLLSHAVEPTDEGFMVRPERVSVSFGDLPLSGNPTVSRSAPARLTFTWDKEVPAGGHVKDQAMLLAYDIENKTVYQSLLGESRIAGEDTLPVSQLKGNTLHIYLSFIAHDRSRQSPSVYLGSITG